MIAHVIPCVDAAHDPVRHGGTAEAIACGGAYHAGPMPLLVACDEPPRTMRNSKGRYGPLRVQLHFADRREGAGIDPGALPGRAGARRLRGALLLSGAR